MTNDDRMYKRKLNQLDRSGDSRTPYERDESRLIHSAAFRRLQSKTQILSLGESDFYRTRLTHSMEVAQIGRGILRYLKSRTECPHREYLPEEALISAICLAHDIGHPPFGHGGEVALNYCMRDNGGFEGNGQTLRILAKLDKYTESNGLNPTRRMLLGVLKYPVPYGELVNEKAYTEVGNSNTPYWLFKASEQKPPKCYLDTEKEIVNFIFSDFSSNDVDKFRKTDIKDRKDKEACSVKKASTDEEASAAEDVAHYKSKYKSLDCTIMNVADNISYSLHDLEDALSLGMITKSQWSDHFKGKETLIDNIPELKREHHLDFDRVTAGLFGESHDRKNTIGALVNLMITSCEITDNGSGCSDSLLKFEVILPDRIDKLREYIFQLVREKVIDDENVQQLEFKGQKLIIELFQVLATDPDRFLPKSTKKRWKDAGEKGGDTAQMRVICDFVAGMTDDYATKFYDKFYTASKGSIFDRL